ncbi:YadA-like family protein [Camelimonas sp. ID_303_24]
MMAVTPAMAQQYSAGSGSSTSQDRDVAVGVGAVASGGHSAAFGDVVTASGLRSAAIGSHTTASGQYSAALGTATTASADYAVAVGSQGTMASQARALAVGYNAQATHADAVAIGGGARTKAAVAAGGVTINGTYYTFAAGAPASVFSIGDTGSERQLVNVAAGQLSATSTDAVNGSQLFRTNEAVTAVNTRVTNLNNGVVDGAIGVVQRSATPNVTVLTAAGGTAAAPGSAQKLTNVANGVVSSASGEAINGSQLYGVSQSIASHLGGGATVGANGVVNGPTYTVQNNPYTTVASAFGAVDSSLGALSETANRGWDLQANGDAKTAVKPGDTVQFLNGQNIKVTRSGGNVTIATVDDLNVTSVTAGNAQLATNGLTITGGPSILTTGINAGNLKVTNVAAGDIASAGSTDAVNGGQLYATNQAVEALGNGVSSGAIGIIQRTATPNVTVLTAAGGTAAVPGAAQKLTNLANGDVDAASTDAINGSQLYGVSQSVASHLGGGATVGANGVVNGPTYVIQGQSYGTVYDSFGAVDSRLTSIGQQIDGIANGGGIKYFHTNSQAADSQAVGANSTAIGPQAVATGAASIATGMNASAQGNSSIALGANATATNAGDVAIGAGASTQAAVQTSTMIVNGRTYDVAGTATATVSFGSAGAERTLTNVAAGRVNASSTDAINGSQLYATNQALETLSGNVGVIGQNAVMYDTDSNGAKKNAITLQGGDANAPVLLSNVATGVADNDAVNVGQLKGVAAGTLASANRYTDDSTARALASANTYTDQKSAETLQAANSYTDQRFGILSGAIGDVRREARQAAAVGLAASSLRYDNRPGKLSMAVGGGAWRGEGALAVGLGYTSESQVLRANISATSSGRQWGVAAGLSLTLN